MTTRHVLLGGSCFGRTLVGISISLIFSIHDNSAHSQVTPTPGAGSLGTQVNPNANVYEITGGTRPGNGPNLFHSFGEFSITAAEIARFQTTNLAPDATIGNILGRVTGGNPSSIFGTIDSISYYPGANLFLMNPAGIVFGPNAVLNVGGSVNFTTADYLRLADGVRFEAIPGAQDALLSTASVDAFGFLGTNPAAIIVQGSQLTVANGTGLSLIGGDITIAPDPDSGATSALMAPSGQINLVSVASPGEVLFPSLATDPNINSQSFTAMGTVSISGGSTLDVSDNALAGNGSGGTVRIRGGQFIMDSAFIFANTFAETNGSAIAVSVDMTSDITLGNASGISASASSTGRVGDVEMTGKNVRLEGGSFISTLSAESPEQGGNIIISSQSLNVAGGSSIFSGGFGEAAAGNITITATDSLNVSGFDPVFGTTSTIESAAFAGGNSGTVDVQSAHVTVAELGKIGTTSVGTGQAGNLSLQTGVLDVLDGGLIASSGGNGSGNITISANEVTVKGLAGPDQRSRIDNSGGGEGGTGDIRIHTDRFLLTDDARINMEGTGQLGTIMVSATESLTISNGGKLRMQNDAGSAGLVDLFSPQVTLNQGIIQTLTVGPGDAGAVAIRATNVHIIGGQINSGTCPVSCGAIGGLGGNISIVAENSVQVGGQFAGRNVGGQIDSAGPAGIFTVTGNSGGNAGNITVTAPQVQITEGAIISAKSTGSGAAGDVLIEGTASPAQSIQIDGSGSGILTETQGTGTGGDITAWANQVQLTNGATISAKTTGSGDAGNILVKANDFSMNGSATITAASTGSGNAGTVTIQGTNSPANSIIINGVGTGIFTSTENTGAGGNILIESSQSTTLINGARISASSTGPGNAGNISINAGQQLNMQNSSITTQAAQASGGNIDIQAIDQVRLINSQISSSVQGGPTTAGGNITIDPNSVILQNSQILAQAVQGNGGNITITTPVFLADPSSLVDASSQFGLNGTVNIQSPTSNLSGTVGQLSSKTRQMQTLLQNRCAALAGGEQSTFILAGRDTLPAEPGGWLGSPLTFAALSGETGTSASSVEPREARGEGDNAGLEARGKRLEGSTEAVSLAGGMEVLSLRRMTPPGFLIQAFATDGSTGCHS